MGRIAECSVIIKDDFNNIFIVRRKTKRNEPKLWYIVGKKIRGKETEEKCIARAIKDDLKSIIFNLEKLGEIKISAEKDELCAVYLGQLKEKIVYGNDIVEGKWVSAKELENYDLAEYEKEKILCYINR
ncbi:MULTISPECIES: NUDIX domain-containing protein [unclassified Clostridium]|uniref:NUDIX domain-containing protein n=1 Tax=unclassified Clostridium TaxID=2614128 RepID=UPI0025C0E8D8|nr:NUDIX domain-containing protein [Clostridium sp.]MCI6692441.1 NUDIX domain-containing protein [Clostridium sp.]MDY2631956.1 NUDIX domain-containing protein [Clostridium sp.]MDY4252792.1 NUDIX domain-containing protein [Clostridium sp.]MDY6227877.1 NUDIX domain-containing protein [Clostridium sp.]